MPEKIENNDVRVLCFDGAQTIATSDDVRVRLADSLASSQQIRLECGGVTEADLSFIQLLLAARRSARAQAKELRLSSPASGPLLDVLRRSGLVQAGGDLPQSADAPFWMEAAP